MAQTIDSPRAQGSRLMRHQLVWLSDAGWAQAQPMAQDAEALAIVGHWRQQHLPLVVTRQPAGQAAGQLSLGLPAPLQWSRRKLALLAPQDCIVATRACPTLTDVAQTQTWQAQAAELDGALAQLGLQARVYGSYAWQQLSGLAYVRADSDIDLCLQVLDFAPLAPLLALLEAAQLPPRLDGEIIFAQGHAVAWRELQQLLNGRVNQVLLKHTNGVRLVDQAHLQALCRAGPC